jgi:hypothetical protein
MPFSAPIIAALIGAGVTGTTTGLEASGAIGGGGPSQSTLQQEQLTQQEAAQKQQQDQLKQAFRGFAPDAQERSGGSLSDASFSQLVAELSGNPGGMELAKQTIFGDAGTTASTGLSAGG